MERHRAVGLAVDELAHERIGRRAHLVGRALRDDPAFGHEIEVVDDLQRFVHVVRDDDRRDAERVVQLADQLADDAERDRIEAGERLVVHDEHRVERDRARERHAPRHAAGQLGRASAARAPRRPTALQLHQHEVADQLLGQVGVLAQRERDVLEHATCR